MSILRIIIGILSLIIISYLLGRLLYGRKASGFTKLEVTGFLLLLALFEVASLPCIFLKTSLKTLAVIMLVIVGSLCVISLLWNWKYIWKEIGAIRFEKPQLITVIIFGLIIFQTIQLGVGMHIDDDDAFYVATATTSLDTDTLYQIDPYTGNYYGTYPARYVLSPFPLFGAVICKWISMRPAVFFHTVLPFYLIPMAYFVYILIGRQVFSGNKRKQDSFLIFIALLNLFSGFSKWTQGHFLLVRIWQGKAVLASILLPFLLWFVLEHFEQETLKWREWICLLCSMVAGCFATSMGIILCIVMLESFALLKMFRTRKIKMFLQSFVCCIPGILLAAIYLFVL